MSADPIVIVSFARTPIGNLLGELQTFSATQLGAQAIKATVDLAKISPDLIDEVLMGCVLPAALGQAPARQAAIHAGLPTSAGCTTVNKVCGSSMKTVMLAHDLIAMGSANIIIAGGMESMTNAPYLLPKARQGYRLGHQQTFDHMMLDGLEDAYEAGKPMGAFAEQCVDEYKFTREQLDEYAISSLKRAQNAVTNKLFTNEIIPLTVKTRKEEKTVTDDEKPFSVKAEKIPSLRPAFVKDGRITAGNSSSIADGAAALLLMRESKAKELGIEPIAKLVGHASFAKKPEQFTTAPIDATKALLEKLNWTTESVDLFEVNEAFAVVAMAFMHSLNIPLEKVNIHGGACALGHPIGATGNRIIVTLLSALQQKKLKRGVATLCIGGGEATAVGVELY